MFKYQFYVKFKISYYLFIIDSLVLMYIFMNSICECMLTFFCTALQVDFSRHALENVRIVNNLQDGLGILYSDLYSSGVANTVKNSEFSGNRGNGISFKQLGLKISGTFFAECTLFYVISTMSMLDVTEYYQMPY